MLATTVKVMTVPARVAIGVLILVPRERYIRAVSHWQCSNQSHCRYLSSPLTAFPTNSGLNKDRKMHRKTYMYIFIKEHLIQLSHPDSYWLKCLHASIMCQNGKVLSRKLPNQTKRLRGVPSGKVDSVILIHFGWLRPCFDRHRLYRLIIIAKVSW
jgi:hypothetical protein